MACYTTKVSQFSNAQLYHRTWMVVQSITDGALCGAIGKVIRRYGRRRLELLLCKTLRKSCRHGCSGKIQQSTRWYELGGPRYERECRDAILVLISSELFPIKFCNDGEDTCVKTGYSCPIFHFHLLFIGNFAPKKML